MYYEKTKYACCSITWNSNVFISGLHNFQYLHNNSQILDSEKHRFISIYDGEDDEVDPSLTFFFCFYVILGTVYL